MKKVTFLLALFISSFTISAQQTISFETNEGYSLGNIHNQNNWVSTGYTDADGNPANIENQVVTNELASDGAYSFKINEEPDFGPQQDGPVIGGFYEYSAPVEYTDAVFSFDVYVDGVAGGSDFRFAAVGEDVDENSDPGMFFVSLIDFDFENNIRIVDSAGEFANIGTYNFQTWYNVRIEIDNSNVTYYIDNVEIGSSVLLSEIDITEFRFISDNYGGAAYIDNFQTNVTDDTQNDCSNAEQISISDNSSTLVNASSINGTATSTVCNVDYYGVTDISTSTWYAYTAGSNDVVVNVVADFDQDDISNNYIPSFNILEGNCDNLTCVGGSIASQNSETDELFPADFSFLAEAGTTYYIVFDDFYANMSPDPVGILDDFEFVISTETMAPPGLATNPTPADEATDVEIVLTDTEFEETGVYFAWDAPTSGDEPDSYEIIVSDVPSLDSEDGTISASNVTTNEPSVPFYQQEQNYFEANTTYYWQIIPSNIAGSPDPENIPVWSFTTGSLSNDDFENSNFTHFYKDGQLGLEASQIIDNVKIYNLQGQEMLNTELSNNNESIDVSNFSNGMYITKVRIGDKTETFKFIKK